jgi:hypothetical protein
MTCKELVQAFAKIPAGVTTLDLVYTNLDKKTNAEVAKILQAIPTGVRNINIENNGLLACKTTRQRDELLARLLPIEQNGRLNLAKMVNPLLPEYWHPSCPQ